MIPVPDFAPAAPEIFLAVAAMVLLLLGVLRAGPGIGQTISWLAVLALLVDLVLVLGGPKIRTVGFSGLYVTDQFAMFMKALILIGSALSVLMSMQFNEHEHIDRFEFPVLILFAVTGMLAMVSANDLISLYVGLELQSLALYVIAAFKRDTVRSTEAGLKYFVLGALSSGMLLFGASLIYGFSGSTSFEEMPHILTAPLSTPNVGLIIGLVFLSVGIAFKCSAVPFHMWTPDVYEGAPTPVTAFFAVAAKIAALALFLRVMISPFGYLAGQWIQIIWTMSVLSMILGSYAAISQTSVKRLMAYSSIANVGYALIGLAVDTPEGVIGVLVYMTIYLFMTLGAFGVILCMERNGKMVERMDDLAGLSRTQPLLAGAMAVFMFSMAGIPPLAGFFSKIAVFMAAIHAHFYWLAVIGVLTSVVGCYYYLRIVKIMYFDEPNEAFDAAGGGGTVRLVVALSALAILLFVLVPGGLWQAADAAAASLFVPG
jgi:NADH-quinone oxidoreductase subunit N